MKIADLVEMQHSFDARHGWTRKTDSAKEKIDFIARDLIGLLGEIGELANLVKRLQLLERFPDQFEAEVSAQHSNLSEEFVDSLIYLLRIAAHLNLDVERAYLEKLGKNELRYGQFEI